MTSLVRELHPMVLVFWSLTMELQALFTDLGFTTSTDSLGLVAGMDLPLRISKHAIEEVTISTTSTLAGDTMVT
jgi:hypothetical protein